MSCTSTSTIRASSAYPKTRSFPPPTRTIERVETELGWELIQLYGLTETSPLITINRRREEFGAWRCLTEHPQNDASGSHGNFIQAKCFECREELSGRYVEFAVQGNRRHIHLRHAAAGGILAEHHKR